MLELLLDVVACAFLWLVEGVLHAAGGVLRPVLSSDRLRMYRTHSIPTPSAPKFMHHEAWSEALFLHYKVNLSKLLGVLPPGLEPATYNGEAYLSVVVLREEGIAPVALPTSLRKLCSITHEAINVRTYVRPCGGKPAGPVGIYFFSLDASSLLATIGARVLFGLPYNFARMRRSTSSATSAAEASTSITTAATTTRVRSDRFGGGRSIEVEYETPDGQGGGLGEAAEGLERFLCEQYCLYIVDRLERLHRGTIHHQPWRTRAAKRVAVQGSDPVAAKLGVDLSRPCRTHVAEAVAIDFHLFERHKAL